MRQVLQAIIVVGVVVGAGCIEEGYVGGATCASSADCPPLVTEEDEPVGTEPEQCVSTGAAFVCVPLPFTRPETSCIQNSECLAAGFPVETTCFEARCQCPDPVGRPPAGCIWNPTTCTCGGTPPPEQGG
jgi:hypothetical protein